MFMYRNEKKERKACPLLGFFQFVVVFVSCVHLPTTTKVVVRWLFEKSYYSYFTPQSQCDSVIILHIMQLHDVW